MSGPESNGGLRKQNELRSRMVGNHDPRVLRTRGRLVDAYRQLLEESSGDPITVTMIVERARVRRSSFYAHFSGTSDLAITALGEFVETVISYARGAIRTGESRQEANERAMREMLGFIDRHRADYGNLLAHDTEFLRSVGDALAQSSLRSLQAREESIIGSVDVSSQFVAGGIERVIGWWLREGIALSPDALAREMLLAFPLDFTGPFDLAPSPAEGNDS